VLVHLSVAVASVLLSANPFHLVLTGRPTIDHIFIILAVDCRGASKATGLDRITWAEEE
jgi:hypothetical protein